MIVNKRYEFELDALISQGGFGNTYKGLDLHTNRYVLIKAYQSDVFSNERLRKALKEEFTISYKLNHPNLVAALDFFEENGILHGVYEFVTGETLSNFHRKSVSKKETINILSQLLDALDFIHKKGIIHRDIKPSNIIIDSKRQSVKLLDFGIAYDRNQISTVGTQYGTLLFSPPEQLLSSFEKIRPATDLWAFGVTLYWMITGRYPFKREHLIEKELVIDGINEIEEPFQKVIRLSLIRDVEKRIQSAFEVKSVLTDYLKNTDKQTLNNSINEELVLKQLEEIHILTIDLRKDISWLKKMQEKLLEVLPARKNKTKILFLAANPTASPLRLDEEVRKISSNLKFAKEREKLELKQEWAITVDSLLQAVLDEAPNFVHFSGHGNKTGIVIEDEIGNPKEITSDALNALFEVLKETVSCVLLNSCFSESQAHAIKEHIPYVIGMDNAIPDKTAIAFSSGFYQAIGAGRSVKDAFNVGIVKIKLEGLVGVEIPKLIG